MKDDSYYSVDYQSRSFFQCAIVAALENSRKLISDAETLIETHTLAESISWKSDTNYSENAHWLALLGIGNHTYGSLLHTAAKTLEFGYTGFKLLWHDDQKIRTNHRNNFWEKFPDTRAYISGESVEVIQGDAELDTSTSMLLSADEAVAPISLGHTDGKTFHPEIGRDDAFRKAWIEMLLGLAEKVEESSIDSWEELFNIFSLRLERFSQRHFESNAKNKKIHLVADVELRIAMQLWFEGLYVAFSAPPFGPTPRLDADNRLNRIKLAIAPIAGA